MTQIFLSHSTHDAELALRLANDLRELGIPVWKAPESILEGERWIPAITRGVTTSTHMLILMSPEAAISNWVSFEFEMAVPRSMRGEIKIIPLEYRECDPPASWMVFQSFKGLSVSYEKTLLRIVKHLNKNQPSYPPDPAPLTMTMNVPEYDDYSGTLNIAKNNISYPGQPENPPIVIPNSEPEPLIEQLTTSVLAVLPEPFKWCAVPGKEDFSMVATGLYDVFLDKLAIEPFFMAKYPITFEQYQVFVDDPQGFKNPEWWERLPVTDHHRTHPGIQRFTNTTNLPRDNVSWYDTIAFCRWLTSQSGYDIRLPTEWEWQWAAAGPNELNYPYGEDFDFRKGNTDENAVKMTTHVMQYPDGASPYGVIDMSGNLWDWCLNQYDDLTNTVLGGKEERVLRGGNWANPQDIAHTSYRFKKVPHGRNGYIGFRIVCL